jgi:hypothetical protein
MRPGFVLCLVLLALYALNCILLTAFLAVGWHAGLHRVLRSANDILILRLLPGVGAVFLLLVVELPAFVLHEPARASERVGPAMWALATVSLLLLGDAIRRGAVAWHDTRALFKRFERTEICSPAGTSTVRVIDIGEPFVALVGGFRPRIVAAKCVFSACSKEEFRQIIAHEAAHRVARDNLKLLMIILAPDCLNWLAIGTTLTDRWRLAAEHEADDRATGSDPMKRISLAGALIKVARLMAANGCRRAILGMPIGVDDIEGRVRQLLAPPLTERGSAMLQFVTWSGFLIPLAAIPVYGQLHEFVEFLAQLATTEEFKHLIRLGTRV